MFAVGGPCADLVVLFQIDGRVDMTICNTQKALPPLLTQRTSSATERFANLILLASSAVKRRVSSSRLATPQTFLVTQRTKTTPHPIPILSAESRAPSLRARNRYRSAMAINLKQSSLKQSRCLLKLFCSGQWHQPRRKQDSELDEPGNFISAISRKPSSSLSMPSNRMVVHLAKSSPPFSKTRLFFKRPDHALISAAVSRGLVMAFKGMAKVQL